MAERTTPTPMSTYLATAGLTVLAILCGNLRHANAATPIPASATAAIPMADRFAAYGHPGAFALLRAGGTPEVLHNEALAQARRVPASSFKVMLSLIALETGALRDENEVVPWNGERYPNFLTWQRDMALHEAMASSSAPFFRTLAKRIGRERLQQWVSQVGYGNQKIGTKPEEAWHDSVLTVTAIEQLQFYDRLRRNDLPFSAATIAKVKAAMRTEIAPGVVVYGKTGTHPSDKGDGVSWWVGWIENAAKGSAAFALELAIKDEMDPRPQRIALGKQLLADVGLAPAQ